MKTHLLTFSVAAGLGLIYQSGASTLMYGYDFNDGSSGSSLVLNNQGEGTVTATKYAGNLTSDTNTAFGEGGNSFKLNTGSLHVTSGSGIGLDTTAGFSVGFHLNLNNQANPQWRDILSIGINGHALKFEIHSSKYINTYIMKGDVPGYGTSSTLDSELPGLTQNTTNPAALTASGWAHIGITVQNGIWQIYFSTKTGDEWTTSLVKTFTDTGNNMLGDVTLLSVGGNGQSSRVSQHLVDNLAVYSGVLSDQDFNHLASSSSLLLPIPETSTATISLLGLAALSLRRRKTS